MVTEKDIIKYIENLPEEFFRERWKKSIEKVGEELMIKAHKSAENYAKTNKNTLLFFAPRMVAYDLSSLGIYLDIYKNVSRDEFEKFYGKSALYDIEQAIKRQEEGPMAYL